MTSNLRHLTFGRKGFTLLELLVVMGIIAILLVVVIPAVTSLSKSSGRKGAIGNLLGAIEQARAEAIKTGQATYVVFPTFTTGSPAIIDRYNYKAYAVFTDDPASPVRPKQLTNWKTFPTGVALRAAGNAPLSSLPNAAGLTPSVAFAFTPDTTASIDNFRCIKFNSNGEIESPAANVTLAIFEGFVNAGTEVITGSKDGSGNPRAMESITIAHLTGRAERGP
ncbi:MAG: type II secretion system protein [Verrucomicrobiota bacterium]